ncbi:MAG: CotH kinase family protein [Tenericutes bacterium]|nr:CotH kinase family protein [Mycoplasmatota bacterium]
MNLALKRIILLFLLCVTIASLTVYGYYHDDGTDFSKYMNVRDQSDDYDRLFDNYNFKSFTISFEEEVFDEMIDNMQAHFDEYGDYIDNTMYPIDLTYRDAETEFTVYEVGFRTKSTTSRNLLRTFDWRDREVYHQTTFQLQFNETFDYEDGTNFKNLLKTREVFNLEQLNFTYSQMYQSDYDETMISEVYTHYLYKQADILVANASVGIVYLQIGDTLVSYGFFTIIEPIDSEFLKDNFKSNLALEYGDLYKVTDVLGEGTLSLNYEDLLGINDDTIRYTYSLRNNSLDGERRTHENFISFVENINDLEYFNNNYEDIFDYDMFARYLAIAFLVGNTDDIRYNDNNYYLYFDVYTNKMSFIPFDLDNSLGFGKHLDLSGNFGVDYSIYYNLDAPNSLVAAFFSVTELVSLYETYLVEFTDDIFVYSDFLSMYNENKEMYESLLVDESHLGNKYFDLRNIEWYYSEKLSNVSSQLP